MKDSRQISYLGKCVGNGFQCKQCGVMHLRRNLDFQYHMNDEERDLGGLMSMGLKFSKCLLAKNKANLMVGIINRGVRYKSAEVISKLYRSYVRHHLEYCIQIWSPINEKVADMLEGVQRREPK